MYLPHTLLNSSCRPNYIAVCMHWQIDNSSFLSSIWDKVIAGSCMILVYVAVAMLLSMRKKILGIQTCEDVSQLLSKVWILDCFIYNSSLHSCMLYIHADLFGLMVAEHVHYVPSTLNRSGHCYIVAYAYDLITLNTLVLIWSPKLNRVGPVKYLGGWQSGNCRCCMLFFLSAYLDCFSYSKAKLFLLSGWVHCYPHVKYIRENNLLNLHGLASHWQVKRVILVFEHSG